MVELAIGLAIAGIMLSAGLAEYKNYYKVKASNTTEERKNKIEQSLTRYLTLHRKLPCPADPRLESTNAQAGKEQCISNCPNPQGVCRVDGMRDTEADNNIDVDGVILGSVPYATLGIPERDAYDGWGSKFGYAVTEAHARPEILTDHPAEDRIYNEDWGAISLHIYDKVSGDENGANPRVQTLVDTNGDGTPDKLQDTGNSYSFVLVSYGPDRKGGYTSAGKRTVACTAGTGRDTENCDGDAVFTLNDRRVDIPGADYYDDAVVVTNVSVDSDKWEFSGGLMTSKNEGNLGIGTEAPERKLHVEGNARATAVNAEKFCDEDGNNCFPAELFGGAGDIAGYGCGGGVVIGVRNGKVECAKNIVSTGITYKSCPDGEFIKSINSAGIIQCATP